MDNAMNNKLSNIIEITSMVAKGYVANNPKWDQEVLIRKIRERALSFEDGFNIKLSEEDLAVISELALRDLRRNG